MYNLGKEYFGFYVEYFSDITFRMDLFDPFPSKVLFPSENVLGALAAWHSGLRVCIQNTRSRV
jgi:hypothetical protein